MIFQTLKLLIPFPIRAITGIINAEKLVGSVSISALTLIDVYVAIIVNEDKNIAKSFMKGNLNGSHKD